MTKGVMIAAIVVLAGVAGVFIALYIEGRKDQRNALIRQLRPQPQPQPQPIFITPVTEINNPIPAPEVPSP